MVTGFLVAAAGMFFLYFAIADSLFLLIYALPLVGVGVYIIFNKKEDSIEEIKNFKEE